ncbi:hypothetical protein [Ramlibacter sp.]|uniref:hypothetical protein n=1 Tax=Ramlibacter sp. TaxID=1917967 RepID=UPI0017E370D6|nr:hypothetical protein [Ramlibacter sp.]MBA2674702.1 hypothetical protein [Ramlibacter sp.]
MPQQILPSMLQMPEDKRFGVSGTQGYVPLPAPPTQPFVYYKDPDVDDPTHRHDDRRDLPSPSASLNLLASQPGPQPGMWNQSMFSQPPTTARKGGGRDPGTAMGGPASALVPGGWSAEPKQGMQASHEWCHLVGDGDGGACAGLNLVIGTNQVNSEQLALENALRPFRPQLEKLGRGIYIDTKATGTERAQAAAAATEPVFEADWIKFTISVRFLDASGPEQFVHTEVMDALRGTITRGEFNALRREAAAKLQVVLRQLREPTVFDLPLGGSWPSDPQAQQHPHVQHNQELLRGSPSFMGSPQWQPTPMDEGAPASAAITDDDGFKRPGPPRSRSGMGSGFGKALRGSPYPDADGRRVMAERRARALLAVALNESADDDARRDARRKLRDLQREITNTDLQQAILVALRKP